MILRRLKAAVSRFREEVRVWRAVLADPRTPRSSRWLLALALASALSPVDLVPDFLPVVGQLDDLVLVPLLLWLALRRIPPEVLAEARARELREGKDRAGCAR